MRALIVLALIFFGFSAGAAETDVKRLRLENGFDLHIKEILPSRIFPHAYYDQAMASIPGVYPDSQVIATRRVGYLRGNTPLLYSMVCYKQSKHEEEITISGVVVHKDQAWSFDTKVVQSSFADTLILVLEAIAELPFNKSLQPKAVQTR
jgi:hypothetical protein